MSFLDKFKKTNNVEDDDEKLNQDYQEILNEQKESHKRALEEAQ